MTTQPLAAYVSLFRGSTDIKPVETVPLAEVLQRIKGGAYRGSVEQLRRLLATKGQEAYEKAKRRSIAFTPAGTFSPRNNASLITPSGCLNLDFDDLTDVDHARALIGADPHLVYLFRSPSDVGLKGGIRVSGYTNAASYRHAWLAVERYLVETYPVLMVSNDTSCKDLSRLCYVSWDSHCYSNPAAIPFPVPPLRPAAPKPTQRPSNTPLPPARRQRYAQQALETAVKILDASVARTPTSNGTRDRQRLKASRLLGGYVAGGVLTEGEAKAGIAAAVERNTDQLQRAWRVIERGLRYGEAAPITLADCEGEYDQWFASRPHRATDTAQPPSPDPDAPELQPGFRAHCLPDHIRHHPDPRVRRHWARIYAKANARKQRLLQDPYALVLPSPPEGATS